MPTAPTYQPTNMPTAPTYQPTQMPTHSIQPSSMPTWTPEIVTTILSQVRPSARLTVCPFVRLSFYPLDFAPTIPFSQPHPSCHSLSFLSTAAAPFLYLHTIATRVCSVSSYPITPLICSSNTRYPTGLLLHRSPSELFRVRYGLLDIRGRNGRHRKYSARPDTHGQVQVQQVHSTS